MLLGPFKKEEKICVNMTKDELYPVLALVIFKCIVFSFLNGPFNRTSKNGEL